jgi:hypothetical protein
MEICKSVLILTGDAVVPSLIVCCVCWYFLGKGGTVSFELFLCN